MTAWARRNRRGQLIDKYGTRTVYEGSAEGGERYLVWYGSRSPTGGSMQGGGNHASLRRAIREAERWERQGYDTKITDRLVPEPTDSGGDDAPTT